MIIRQLAQNRAWGGFLDGIPPHRFEPRYVLEKREEKIDPLSRIRPKGSERKSGAPDLPRRMAKRTSVRAEPCTRGKMGCPASAQRQVASNEKAPFVRTAQ